jgi:2-hydroxy-3-oxopropionate reductase
MSKTTVGFIGLGIMGRPMAANLLAAGHELLVHNRSPDSVAALVAAGAGAAATPREVAERSDVIITMLPDSPDVEAVYRGSDGVLAGVRSGHLLIDMSTIAPTVARSLALNAGDLGAEMLDAPVSGGDVGARDGTLSIMVGGTEPAFDRALPLLQALGKTIVRVGGSGTGQVAKAANQVLVALTIEAVSEALVLGSKAGIDPGTLLDVLGGGLAANRVIEVRRRNFLEHDFTPGFRARLHRKDLGIALAAGTDLGVSLPGTALVHALFEALIADGREQDDHSALLTVIERLAKHSIGSAG